MWLFLHEWQPAVGSHLWPCLPAIAAPSENPVGYKLVFGLLAQVGVGRHPLVKAADK